MCSHISMFIFLKIEFITVQSLSAISALISNLKTYWGRRARMNETFPTGVAPVRGIENVGNHCPT